MTMEDREFREAAKRAVAKRQKMDPKALAKRLVEAGIVDLNGRVRHDHDAP